MNEYVQIYVEKKILHYFLPNIIIFKQRDFKPIKINTIVYFELDPKKSFFQIILHCYETTVH